MPTPPLGALDINQPPQGRAKYATGMDLKAWIVSDLQSLRAKLAGGVLRLIPAERLGERVDGGGIAPTYILWHLARHHDAAVNAVLRGGGEVVEGWEERLGVDSDLWRGLAESEDQELVEQLNSVEVGEYTLAVISSTASWLAEEGLPRLDAIPDAASALASQGVPEDRFGWLYEMWDGKPAAWFLSWSAIGHGFNHLGELVSIRNRMGLCPF